MIEPFEIVGTSDHLKEVELTGAVEAIPFSQIEEKLVFMKIGIRKIVAQIPNNYEKT